MNSQTFNPVLDIKELFLRENILDLVVKVTCPADVRVHSPKVRVIFERDDEERRLPLPLEASYISDDLASNILFAKYSYLLDQLFINGDPYDTIKLRFALSFGDEYVEDIPFTVSRDISFTYEGYLVSTDNQKRYLTIARDRVEEVKLSAMQRILRTVSTGVKWLIKNVYSLILYVLGFLLLPLFFVDAVIAALGLSPTSKLNKSTGLKWFLSHMRWRYSSFCKQNLSIVRFKQWYLKRMYRSYSHKPVVGNRVSFLSSRRMDMTGNLGFVHAACKANEREYDIQELLDPNSLLRMSLKSIRKLTYLCATSKILLIDDFFPVLNLITLKEETKLIQLWHACGAFKTFGFTRLGMSGGPRQSSLNHRNYDYAIVSSKEIAKFYAEGFGIPSSHVVATGVPRTDIFFSENYKNRVVEQFYREFPKLRKKKIILFAPTFRGNGKESAFYPENRFDPVKVYEETNHEYAIIIKHHPFVKNQLIVPEEYKDYIIDLSEQSELNDLLFVTDVVITDYSSLIFEASLLNVPMLFYAYDLRRYVATRDFYYEYELFVPGKIVSNQTRLIHAIKEQDFDADKIDTFRKRFFDHQDGRSTERVVQLLNDIIEHQ